MPEAIMILLDNSQYSINGDYLPTRWNSQIDCAGLLIQARMQADHQVHIGLGLMAGKQTQIICTPTSDSSKVSAYLYGNHQNGLINFCQSIQIASLALKHRADTTLRQRIIIFVASTINDSIEQIRIIGKKCKKNGIAVDLIGLGDTSLEQKNKLSALFEAVNQEDTSSMKMIEPSNSYLSDILLGSEIFGGDRGIPMINEQDDPQLAMALKMSLQQQNTKNKTHKEGEKAENNLQDIDQAQLQRKALELSLEENNNKGNDKKQDDDKMKEQ